LHSSHDFICGNLGEHVIQVRFDQHRSHEKIRAQTVGQVDLAPTLGLMMGVGVPISSVGRVLRPTFELGASVDTAGHPTHMYIAAQWTVAQQLTDLLASKTGASASDPETLGKELSEAYHKAETAAAAAAVFAIQNSSSPPHPASQGADVSTDSTLDAHAKDVDAYVDLIQKHLLALLVSGGTGEGAGGRLLIGLLALASTVFVTATQLAPVVVGGALENVVHVPEATVILPGLVLHLATLTSSSAIENEHVVWFHVVTLWITARLLRCIHSHLKVGWFARFAFQNV
jgi:hypothetical protein